MAHELSFLSFAGDRAVGRAIVFLAHKEMSKQIINKIAGIFTSYGSEHLGKSTGQRKSRQRLTKLEKRRRLIAELAQSTQQKHD